MTSRSARRESRHLLCSHAAEPDVELTGEQQDAEREEKCADRPLDEHEKIAARNQRGSAEVLLKSRAEHEAEQKGCGVKAEPKENVADDTDARVSPTWNMSLLALYTPMHTKNSALG